MTAQPAHLDVALWVAEELIYYHWLPVSFLSSVNFPISICGLSFLEKSL